MLRRRAIGESVLEFRMALEPPLSGKKLSFGGIYLQIRVIGAAGFY